jgi:hypothetical protein
MQINKPLEEKLALLSAAIKFLQLHVNNAKRHTKYDRWRIINNLVQTKMSNLACLLVSK